jgi:hypothetical protein
MAAFDVALIRAEQIANQFGRSATQEGFTPEAETLDSTPEPELPFESGIHISDELPDASI